MFILHQEGAFFYCPFFTDLFTQAGEHNSLHKRSRNSAASAFKAGGAGGSGRDCKGKRQRSGKADSPQSEACGLHR